MSKVEEIFEKLMKMKLSKLLAISSSLLDEKIDEDKLKVVLLALETRLKKRSMCLQIGVSLDEEDKT